MSNIILQQTSRDYDILLYDDDTVTVDGAPAPSAVVTEVDGIKRVSLEGDTIIQVNAAVNEETTLCNVRIVREEGWQGSLGWRAELLDWNPTQTPNAMALAIYSNTNAQGYLFTPGAFVLTDGVWGCVCPPGHEPGQENIHFSMLIGSIPYSAFTLQYDSDDQTFLTGGDFA